MKKIVFILGPTATGKSSVALYLAEKTGAQIVSCDSMLVYKEASIITAKPADQELKKVTHHFVDIISVRENYDVFSYYKEASELIRGLHSRGVPLIVCGGTGLYAKALLDGIFEGVPRDEVLREKFSREAEENGVEELYQKLYAVDPETAEKVSPNDLKRIIRGLEVYEKTGRPISELQKEVQGLWEELPVKLFALNMERDALYERINERVDAMCEKGAVEEVKKILDLPLSRTAAQIIGIKELGAYIKEKSSLEEAKEEMKKNTRNFAKRQFTWFNAEKRLKWISADNRSFEDIGEEVLKTVDRSPSQAQGKDKG